MNRWTGAFVLLLMGCVSEGVPEPDELPTDTAPPPGGHAEISSSQPTGCPPGYQRDLFEALSARLTNTTSNPTLDLTLDKCDHSGFVSTKRCHLHEGSNQAGQGILFDFTWRQGVNSMGGRMKPWRDRAGWLNAPCGDQVELYLTCDEVPNGPVSWWYQPNPVIVTKVCP
jgi:hypothetical protein